MNNLKYIFSIFSKIIDNNIWEYTSKYEEGYSSICEAIGVPSVTDKIIKENTLNVICKKLDIYKKQYRNIIDVCAVSKVFFNYHEKLLIDNSIVANDKTAIKDLLESKGISKDSIKALLAYKQRSTKEILEIYHSEVDADKNKCDIIASIFSGVLYSLFHENKLHLFNSSSTIDIEPFYDFLKASIPEKYDRSHTLSVIKIDAKFVDNYEKYTDLLATIFHNIKTQYSLLKNYCYLTILIDSDVEQQTMWSLFADITLYAEKFIEESLKIGYFHPDKIEEATSNYIPELDKDKCNFKVSNTGFTYKDCYVISGNEKIEEKEDYSKYKILLLFQKNERDESIVPCPACRSMDVRGNSYPVLGVKSWECHNEICPDKSKYNRGKRYSFAAIVKQEAINDPQNLIDRECFDSWRLDVVTNKSDEEIVTFLVKQYSLYNDTVFTYNFSNLQNTISGREIRSEAINTVPDYKALSFWESSYFSRFAVDSIFDKLTTIDNIGMPDTIVYNGDCKLVLSAIPDNFFDGAVTSPPYYNARSYSQWNNIYCYLYDMYNQTKELYRTLKPGAYYLYNIFDYFDNENNVVFSAMGKKRMILGAYIIYLFKKIGFEIQQNIIWNKGQIQGHRSSNQGNYSPYYQAPLNCYEHIFAFRKPAEDKSKIDFPMILHASPVFKMINGINTVGHTAPYPLDIPDLLNSRLQEGIVLDPYSGSFTTAVSARFNGLRSVSIELSEEYCKLGIKRLKERLF